jgi:hypothetical protein
MLRNISQDLGHGLTVWHDVSNGKQLSRACGTYEETRGVSVEFWWGGRKEGDHLEDLDVGGRLMLKLILKMWDDSMDWIDLTQVRERWKAFVNAVMNLRVS